MEKVFKQDGKEIFVGEMNISLANAIRRSVNEVKTLAMKEVEIYKNDSSFPDEILAHRIGLVPLTNEKLKEGDEMDLKFKIESKEDGFDVLSERLGELSCIKNIPIVRLNKGQAIEIVGKASMGTGKEHARHLPGLIYYYNYNKIAISAEGKKHSELAEKYPLVFEFNNELKVKNEWACNFDTEDVNTPGITITPTEELVFVVESWGMMSCSDIINESVKVLNKNLEELKKELK